MAKKQPNIITLCEATISILQTHSFLPSLSQVICLINLHLSGSIFSTEDMSFEFKKAFAKATELRSLTFSQQWTMTDDSIFTTETPVSMALFNVPPGKTTQAGHFASRRRTQFHFKLELWLVSSLTASIQLKLTYFLPTEFPYIVTVLFLVCDLVLDSCQRTFISANDTNSLHSRL